MFVRPTPPWIAEAFGDESPVLQDASKTLCTPELVREPLQPPADLDQYQLFSLMASRVTDVMHRDLLDKTELAAFMSTDIHPFDA